MRTTTAQEFRPSPSPFSLILGDGRMKPDPCGLALAARHRLDLLLYDRLRREEPLAADMRIEADRALDAAGTENRRLLTELQRVLACLSEAGIPGLPLKGPVLAQWLWMDLRLRRCSDIDLLVPAEQAAEAVRVLGHIGYRAPPPAGGLIREVHLEHETEPCILDLHWNVVPGEVPFSIPFDEIWNDRRQVCCGGATFPAIGPEWLFVIVCLYLVKDYPWPRPIYLSDLARLIARTPDLDWVRIAAIAKRMGVQRICASGLTLVGSLSGAVVPETARRLVPADRRALSAARRIERAVSAMGACDDADDPACRLRKILCHPGFRERPADKLRVFGSFVPLLLRPGRSHAGQSWAKASLKRLARLTATVRRPSASRPTDGTSFFPLDDGALLLPPTGDALYALSPSAATLWCLLGEGVSPRAAARHFADDTGYALSRARAEIAAALRDWREAGLVGTARPAREPVAPSPVVGGASAPQTAPLPPTPPDRVRAYRLLDTVFEVRFPDLSLAKVVDTAIGHLATTDPKTANAVVYHGEHGITITVDGRVIERCADVSGVAPAVKAALAIDAANRQDFGLFLHAALLRRGGSGLLLPAAPGRGKTCLAAALARAGFDYCSDEIVLLDRETLHARGLPTALAVKDGAWELLKPLYPELPSMRAHHRSDGKIVKYLPPPVAIGAPPADAPLPVRTIVLPRYVPDGAAELRRVARADALQQVMTECLAMRMTLTAEQVGDIVRWIEMIDCCTLLFSDLSSATRVLSNLFPEDCDGTGSP